MLTNISKHIETLEELYVYKEFLDSVSSKSKSIENNQLINEAEGDIENEDLENKHPNIAHSNEPKSPLKLIKGLSVDKQSKKARGAAHKKDPLEELLGHRNIKLRQLIEDNTFKYDLDFKTPDDLLKHFEMLEEKNLFLIQQTQEAEQAIEEKNQEYRKIKKKLNKENEKVNQGIVAYK